MNSHKHARLTYARRVELVEELTKGGVGTTQAALDYGVTPQTVRKWLGRFLAGGQASLADASSRPAHSPRTIDESKALLIVELRRRRMNPGEDSCERWRFGVDSQPCTQARRAIEAQGSGTG